MTNYPKIAAFPDDNKRRVVWWYGPVVKSTSLSLIPEVKIITKEFIGELELSQKVSIYRIPITELELVRIGTIWVGQERVDEIYTHLNEYQSSKQYSFDFTATPPESISFAHKIGEAKWLIPPFRYDLGDFSDQTILKSQFLKSTITKLISKSGTTVLVPALELLTSAIAPEHKLLRSKLLQYPIDYILSEYIHRGYKDDEDAYIVESKSNYFSSNLTLIAYMQLNQVSRSRLSQIWTSMEDNQSKYPERYPIILPYHANELILKGDGIQIDAKTFLILRINGFSLPAEHSIYNIVDEYGSNSTQPFKNESDRKIPKANNPLDQKNLKITGNKNPHREAGEIYIKTEVDIIGFKPKIEILKKSKNNNEPPISIPAEKQELTTLSSGEQNSMLESKGAGASKQAKIETKEESGNIGRAAHELNALATDPDSGLSCFAYIDNDGSENTQKTYCYATESDFSVGHKRKWYINNKSSSRNNLEEATKENLRYRKFFIAKIILNDNRIGYMLEIEQKGTEAFSGILFNINGNLTQKMIKDLLIAISNNEGRYKRRENGKKGKLIPLDIPVIKSHVFEHRENQSLSKHIEDGITKGIFT